jgi:predicted amidophosphoribosyltransferase
MGSLFRLLSPLAPPCCAACRRSCAAQASLCEECEAELAATPIPPPIAVPGLEATWAALPHDGAARRLVAALKFGRLLPVAELMAWQIEARAPTQLLAGAVVPTPAAPSRLLRRGFDPAEQIATRLAELTGLPLWNGLARADGPRQVGRSRAARLAKPPRVRAVSAVPAVALLVDDVQTTGATLRACAQALREAGSTQVSAVTFARSL